MLQTHYNRDFILYFDILNIWNQCVILSSCIFRNELKQKKDKKDEDEDNKKKKKKKKKKAEGEEPEEKQETKAKMKLDRSKKKAKKTKQTTIEFDESSKCLKVRWPPNTSSASISTADETEEPQRKKKRMSGQEDKQDKQKKVSSEQTKASRRKPSATTTAVQAAEQSEEGSISTTPSVTSVTSVTPKNLATDADLKSYFEGDELWEKFLSTLNEVQAEMLLMFMIRLREKRLANTPEKKIKTEPLQKTSNSSPKVTEKVNTVKEESAAGMSFDAFMKKKRKKAKKRLFDRKTGNNFVECTVMLDGKPTRMLLLESDDENKGEEASGSVPDESLRMMNTSSETELMRKVGDIFPSTSLQVDGQSPELLTDTSSDKLQWRDSRDNVRNSAVPAASDVNNAVASQVHNAAVPVASDVRNAAVSPVRNADVSQVRNAAVPGVSNARVAGGPPAVHNDGPPAVQDAPGGGDAKVQPAVHDNAPGGGDADVPPAVHDNAPSVGDADVPPAVHDNAPGVGDDGPPAVHNDAPGGGDAVVPPAVHDDAPGGGDAVVPPAANDDAPGGGDAKVPPVVQKDSDSAVTLDRRATRSRAAKSGVTSSPGKTAPGVTPIKKIRKDSHDDVDANSGKDDGESSDSSSDSSDSSGSSSSGSSGSSSEQEEESVKFVESSKDTLTSPDSDGQSIEELSIPPKRYDCYVLGNVQML